LARALKRIDSDDTLIVTRLDRLARSTRDLLNILHALDEKGASFKSLHDAWADTTSGCHG
jgi:DNA invertase Pin-like site-specific DNA recombinase